MMNKKSLYDQLGDRCVHFNGTIALYDVWSAVFGGPRVRGERDRQMNTINCGRCHECGTTLRVVLDGEEWCDVCRQYRRYNTHGWRHGEESSCAKRDVPALPR